MSFRVLSRYYHNQRQADSRSAARTTLRLLESLIRLAQAHARLMCRHVVTIQDAIVAVTCVECSMQNSALLGATNALHTKFPEDPEEEYKAQAEMILKRLRLNDLLGKLASNGNNHDVTEGCTSNSQHVEQNQNVSENPHTSQPCEGRLSTSRLDLQSGDEQDLSSPPVQAFDLDVEASTAQSNVIDSGSVTNLRNFATNTDLISQDTGVALGPSTDVAPSDSNTRQTFDNEETNTQNLNTAAATSNELDTTSSDVLESSDVALPNSETVDNVASGASFAPVSTVLDARENRNKESSGTDCSVHTKTICSKWKRPQKSGSLPRSSSSFRLEQFAFAKTKNSRDDTTADNAFGDCTTQSGNYQLQNAGRKDNSRDLVSEKNAEKTLNNNGEKPRNAQRSLKNANESPSSGSKERLISLFRRGEHKKIEQINSNTSNTPSAQVSTLSRVKSQACATPKNSIFTTECNIDDDLDLEWPDGFLSKISKQNNTTNCNKRASSNIDEPSKKKRKDL